MRPHGYGYPPPKRGLSTLKKALIGILAVLGFLVLAGAALSLILGNSPPIHVSPPSGWQSASEETKKNTGNNLQDKTTTVDYVFSNGTLSDSIMVYHKGLVIETPSSGSYNDVKDFYDKHRDEYIQQLKSSYGQKQMTLNLNKEEVVEMTCGISAIHLSFAVTANGKGISQDFLIFYKDGTEYGAIVTKAGSHSNAEDLDYLEKNISFE